MATVIVLTLSVSAQRLGNYIVLDADTSKNSLDMKRLQYQQILEENPFLENMSNKEKFDIHLVPFYDQFILKVGPFKSGDGLVLTYLKMRESFPKAFIEEDTAQEKAIIPKTQYIEKKVYVERDDQTLWTALFGLAIIGILSLYLSSDQLKNLRLKHKRIQERQEEIEEKQSLLLEKMGEKIQTVALKSVSDEKELLETPLKNIDEDEIKDRIGDLKKYDEELLRTTYELIDFLKIKSGNIVIRQEAFQLSNMLHKLTNAVASSLEMKEHTLVYDIQSDVTRYLVGDSVRVYQVLHNLLLDAFESEESSEVVLSIEIRSEENIVFSIINKNKFLTDEEIERLFIPNTWEEIQQSKKDFGFFVIRELVSNMNGNFLIQSHKKTGTLYEISLPYTKDMDNKSNKEELSKLLMHKKALVVDTNTKKAEILTKILASFNIETTFLSSENLAKHKPNMEGFDFVVLKSEDVTKKVFHFFQDITQDDDLDMIVINNIYNGDNSADMVARIADAELFSPLIIGDVEEVLKQLCIKKASKTKDELKKELRHFRIIDIANVTRTDFQKFTKQNILIVEDNLVSQQVLSTVLNASRLNVTKVENGLEALNYLETNADIDLIFMDMDMPVMNGFQTTREIRKLYPKTKIPIVAITGLGFNYEMEQMILAGVDACITKPFKVGQLYIALQRFLKQEEGQVVFEEKKYPILQEDVVLDAQKGIAYTRSESFYKEIILQVSFALKNSESLVAQMIQKDQLEALRVFCIDTFGLSGTIGAIRFANLLNEMLLEVSKEEAYMSKFILLYKEEWLSLESEIKEYLKR